MLLVIEMRCYFLFVIMLLSSAWSHLKKHKGITTFPSRCQALNLISHPPRPLSALATTTPTEAVPYITIPLDPASKISSTSLKDLLTMAKQSPKSVASARSAALEYLDSGRIVTAKDAMRAVSIFKLARDLPAAFRLLDQLSKNHVNGDATVDTRLTNNVLDVCARVGDWEAALGLLSHMRNNGIVRDKISYSTAISACAKAGQWSKSLDLLDEMSSVGLQPDTICFSSAVSACANAAKWREALSLVKKMKHEGVKVDAVVYNTCIHACSLAGEWKRCLGMMTLMQQEGIPLDAYSYTAAINACDKAGRSAEAVHLLERMISSQLSDTHVSDTNEDPASISKHAQPIPGMVEPGEGHSNLPRLTNRKSFDLKSSAATAPFNAAISSCMHSGQLAKGLEIFQRMRSLDVPANTITYSCLITGLARAQSKDKQWARFILDLYSEMCMKQLIPGDAVFGSVLSAAETEGRVDIALEVLSKMEERERCLINEDMRRKRSGSSSSSSSSSSYGDVIFNHNNHEKAHTRGPTTSEYNLALSACATAGKFDEAVSILTRMKDNKVPRNSQTYTYLIMSCKREGRWEDALQYLEDMESDRNTEDTSSPFINNNHNNGIAPDTFTFSAAISVCVESKQWNIALDLLERMEALGIARNVITYNSAIEALDAAGETVRAELVYQSALRMNVYNHWYSGPGMYGPSHLMPNGSSLVYKDKLTTSSSSTESPTSSSSSSSSSSSPSSTYIMDLHKFPLAVARAAVMHVLGDMCSERVSIADPLVIITGRGKHLPSKGNKRGTLKSDMINFLTTLGFNPISLTSSHPLTGRAMDSTSASLSSNNNPGRIVLPKRDIEQWLQVQKEDDLRRKNSGSAHGNLFLAVARAKQKDNINMKAVCPFSSATHVSRSVSSQLTSTVSGKSSFVDKADSSTPLTTSVTAVPISEKKGVCPAHAHSQQASSSTTTTLASDISTPVPEKKGVCPAHAHSQSDISAPTVPEKKGVCPAHAHSQQASSSSSSTTTLASDVSTPTVSEKKGVCPAHAHSQSDVSTPASEKKGVCPAHVHSQQTPVKLSI